MDSVKVLLENWQRSDVTWWSIIRDWLTIVATLGGTFVALYAIRKTNEMRKVDLAHSEKLKQWELMDAEKERKSYLQRKVTEQALEVLLQSYHLTHAINCIFACTGPNLDVTQKDDLYQRMREVRTYWEKNYALLPTNVRQHVYGLTNVLTGTLQQGVVGARSQEFAFDKVAEMFKALQSTLDTFMAEYNLFNQLPRDLEKGEDSIIS